MATISTTQSDILEALRAFLLGVLPSGWEIIAAEINRVPEPKSTRFVVMTPIRIKRLRTNIDTAEDVAFTAAMSGTSMVVSAVEFGTILIGSTVFGTGVQAGTVITAQVNGTPGGAGTYTITPGQGLPSREMSAGNMALEQGAEIVVQLDFHSADLDAGDAAQIVSTSFRDPYGVDSFATQTAYGVVPLFADDPRQMPFINAEQQYEWRWVLEATMQANQVVRLPQQYADAVEVEVISVDAAYPP